MVRLVRGMISFAAIFLFGTTTVSFCGTSRNQDDIFAEECGLEGVLEVGEDLGEEELPYDVDEAEELAEENMDGNAGGSNGENWQKKPVASTPEDAAAAENTEKQNDDAQNSDAGQTQAGGQEEENTEPTKPEDLIPPDNAINSYKVRKYSCFFTTDHCSVKKIVTKLNDDGTFLAEDLGSWLKKQDVYDISVVMEDDGGYKMLYYKSNLENQDREAFYPTEDTAELCLKDLVSEGDTITLTDSCFEFVRSVEPDGSFYTEYEESWLLEEE